MKKKILILAVMLVLIFTTSCGKIDKISHEELIGRLTANVGFSEPLVEIDEITIQKQLFINPNEYSNITMYVGTRAICDQIIIVDTANGSVVEEKIQNYLDNQKNVFTLYRPGEAEKLSKVFKSDFKGTKIYVVSPDSEKVSMVFENYINKK